MKKEENEIRKRKHSNIIGYSFIIVVVIIIVLLTSGFASMAKYVYNAIHYNFMSSKNFYFNSDKLSTEHTEFQITNNWSGAETYTATINLTSKKNDLVFTESNVNYNVSVECSDNIECTLSKSSGTIIGTDNNGINEDSFEVYINPKNGRILNNTEIAWVELTVESTSPYTEELSGKLILQVGSSDIYYEITDSPNSPYLMVNIVNSSAQNEDVTLSFSPQNVLLDMTSRFYLNSTATTTTMQNSYSYINSVTSNVNSLSTKSIKFYKIDPTQDYSYLTSDSTTPIITLSY